MNKNTHYKHPKKPLIATKPLFVIIAVLVLCGLAGGYGLVRKSSNNKTKIAPIGFQASKTPETTPTFQSNTEGNPVTVPKDVPADSIKNYILITENEEYKIRYNGSTYLITLYAIINNPSQYSTYQDQLRQYKLDALAYLKNKGIDVNSVKIEYEPKEATNL